MLFNRVLHDARLYVPIPTTRLHSFTKARWGAEQTICRIGFCRVAVKEFLPVVQVKAFKAFNYALAERPSETAHREPQTK